MEVVVFLIGLFLLPYTLIGCRDWCHQLAHRRRIDQHPLMSYDMITGAMVRFLGQAAHGRRREKDAGLAGWTRQRNACGFVGCCANPKNIAVTCGLPR